LAHLDDNFIRHFANESTFTIDITPTPRHSSTSPAGNTNSTATSSAAAADDDAGDNDGDAGYDVTLSEIDVYSSVNTAASSKH